MLIKNIILLRGFFKVCLIHQSDSPSWLTMDFLKKMLQNKIFFKQTKKTCFHAKSSISPILCGSFNEVQQHIVSETFEFGLLIDFQIPGKYHFIMNDNLK